MPRSDPKLVRLSSIQRMMPKTIARVGRLLLLRYLSCTLENISPKDEVPRTSYSGAVGTVAIYSFSTTIFPHSLQRKHRPPQRKVISCLVALPHFQHQTCMYRA